MGVSERSANFANLPSVSFDTTSEQQPTTANFYDHAYSTRQSRRRGVLSYYPHANVRCRHSDCSFSFGQKAAHRVPRFCFCVVPCAFQLQLHTLRVPVSAEQE